MNKRLPPLLLGAGILLWGLQTGLWIFAVPACIVLEIDRWLRRWDLSEADFRNVSYVCTIGFVGMSVYLALTRPLGMAVMTALSWFPIAVLPLVIAQRFSSIRSVPASSLFPIVGRRFGQRFLNSTIDVTHAFLALCIFAASAANSQTIWFYVLMTGIAGWALWSVKPQMTKTIVWLAILLTAAAAGYAGHVGLHALQGKVEGSLASPLLQSGLVSGGDTVSSVRNTAIGSIGTIKLSGAIRLRVVLESGTLPPLLHTLTFTSYSASQWTSGNGGSLPIERNRASHSWNVGSAPTRFGRIRIAAYLSGNPGVLPLPDRSTRIESAGDLDLRRDHYDSVLAAAAPGLAKYEVDYGVEGSASSPPESADLFVQPSLRSLFAGVAHDLQLEAKSPRQKVQAIASYFQNNFTYSLYQANRDPQSEPLQHFLRESHAGHCEYFATATTLLLRTAGIPARYAVGYSIQEWNQREHAYIVRNRHAHAWARVFVDGVWEDLDTTPASWVGAEAAQAGRWENVRDWLSWNWYRALQYQAGNKNAWGNVAVGLGLVALIPVIWTVRLFRRKRTRQSGPARLPIEGGDSEFYRVELFLERAGYGRLPAESVQSWIARLDTAGRKVIDTESLRSLAALHYRYRFDPNGLRTQDRTRLKLLAESWITKHARLRSYLRRMPFATNAHSEPNS